MSEVELMNLLEIGRLTSEVPIDKLVFWTGAGIDCGASTSLPLGEELTDHILSLACGEEHKNNLIKEWEKNAEFIQRASEKGGSLSKKPRLETIVETIREFESHQLGEKVSVLEGLRAFSASNLPPNDEHYTLAYFLYRGASIVTTNYGDFICKAYEDRYGEGTIRHEQEDLHIYRVDNKWKSGIYHIHGISSDLNTIGANLSNVKNSLPQYFKSLFEYWVENNYYIIFMGYSGLDSLDVNPFFKAFSKNNNAVGIYVRHTIDGDISAPTDREEILLRPFKNKIICPCITSHFFPKLKEYREEKTDKHKLKYDWKDMFNLYATKYTPEYSNTFMLGLCYQLGIPITSIFRPACWLKLVLQCEGVDEWYKTYYAFQNAVIIGEQKTVRKLGHVLEEKYKDELMDMDYNTARGRISQPIRQYDSPMKLYDEIEGDLKRNHIINWKISTSLNCYMQIQLFKALRFPFCIKRTLNKSSFQDINRDLIKSCDLIISGGYNCVQNVNQINNAYRTLAVCQILNREPIDYAVENVNKAVENYIDISSTNGVAMTVLYLAVIWLINYSLHGENNSLLNAKYNLDVAHKIIFECKLRKYAKYYYVVKVLCQYLKYMPNLYG